MVKSGGFRLIARVVELAYTTVLEAVAERRAGSSPVPSTRFGLRDKGVRRSVDAEKDDVRASLWELFLVRLEFRGDNGPASVVKGDIRAVVMPYAAIGA